MILCVKKTLVLKQYEYWFFTVLQSTLQTVIENINGWLRKTDQDINNYSVLESIALTLGCSVLA